MSTTLKKEDGVSLCLITIGMPFARRCIKASKEKIEKTCTFRKKEMSRTVGVKKPQEAQKAKAVWKMKAAKDRKEEFYGPAREETLREEIKRDWCVEVQY